MIRHYTKWDDQPASPQAAVESVLRANQIARSAPRGPVYICLDAGACRKQPLTEKVSIPDPARFAPAPSPAVAHASMVKAMNAIDKAKFPLILMGRVSRKQADWDRRVRFAETVGAAVLDQQQRPGFFSDDPSAASRRALFAPEQGGDGVDRESGPDPQHGLARPRRRAAPRPRQSADPGARGQDDYPLFDG
jgi:thiamine pyrophosphate-dependent acetolactate synthase large subunit-like protein